MQFQGFWELGLVGFFVYLAEMETTLYPLLLQHGHLKSNI